MCGVDALPMDNFEKVKADLDSSSSDNIKNQESKVNSMERISISDVEGDVDYNKVFGEFGLDRFEQFHRKMLKEKVFARAIKKFPMFRRGLVFAHRDFGQIYRAISGRKKFAVLTGANPSGPLHFGHRLFLEQALFFQKLGADVYIPVSDDETYVFRKSRTLEQATRNAYNQVIPDILGFGFDPKKTHIFVSTQTQKVYELAVHLSTRSTFSMIKAIYGFTNETNPGQIFYGTIQSAHILFPEFIAECHPIVVPIGIDQDPHMRLARDIAERAGFHKPSSTYHKYIPGLQGGKMSASKPNTCIFLTDDKEKVRKKLMSAFSGGGGTLREHKEKGGNPDVDVAFQYLYFFLENDDKKIEDIDAAYRNGSLPTGELKQMAIDKLIKYLKEYQKRRAGNIKHTDKFLLEKG